MARYLIRVEYVGTRFHGFQRQPGLATVQGELERAVSSFTGREVRVLGAGRTDAGVHALGQAAAFDLDGPVDEHKALSSLNALTGPDISVGEVSHVDDGFDPRREALWREYRYFVLNRRAPSALLAPFSHHVPGDLDRDRMSQAAALLEGEHDFSAFRAKADGEAHARRTVLACEVSEPFGDVLSIRVRANAFLYKMVRIMAGAITCVGGGRMEVEAVRCALEGAEKPCADPLPPQGLFLWHVKYPQDALTA